MPIVMVVYHREDDTRRTLEQLARVTDDYSLILVNNGFDDPTLLHSFGDSIYLENTDNLGAIRAINQGLEVATGEYVCVLHNDLLIYDEGWLDHIIEFLERRPDVGIVGLAGRHTINEDGTLDYETTVVDMARYDESFRPTWRFTEVATIDGLGWVMRNLGFRLDESYGLMHYYDVDLSLQYVEAGYLVYTAAVELDHVAEEKGRSTRDAGTYLDAIGGDDAEYYERARRRFRSKWGRMLPMNRGYRDESYGYNRIDELRDQYRALEGYAHEKELELEEAVPYVRRVEKALDDKQQVLLASDERVRELERELEATRTAMNSSAEELVRAKADAAPPRGGFHRFLFYLGRYGFRWTFGRVISSFRARLRPKQ